MSCPFLLLRVGLSEVDRVLNRCRYVLFDTVVLDMYCTYV
jgi:hypothetical protein